MSYALKKVFFDDVRVVQKFISHGGLRMTKTKAMTTPAMRRKYMPGPILRVHRYSIKYFHPATRLIICRLY
ncbi:hypothetical protein UNDKW_3516 [Undibacterium sp. KW1]|uniref:hypothetical protein n=1 Tax=Undibacterium sp. KW1 TaxID=2058624 RepID=UPI001331CFE6|nr:hypothetical protein [Undibacterium sp. KW1]BBB61789.1 hypothetical protein UNDKW_3516 [Undibacterium sp. KW1]